MNLPSCLAIVVPSGDLVKHRGKQVIQGERCYFLMAKKKKNNLVTIKNIRRVY